MARAKAIEENGNGTNRIADLDLPEVKGAKTRTKRSKEESDGDDETAVLVGQRVRITPPNFQRVSFKIQGTAPLVVNRFSEKAKQQMMATQSKGSQNQKGAKREPKDFDKCYEDAKYISHDGWNGFAAMSVKHALVSVCRLIGYKMTLAKIAVSVIAEGADKFDGTPLIQIRGREPHRVDHSVRNQTGVADVRARPMWDEGWHAFVTVEYDGDLFEKEDIANLLSRAGTQNGICEGRMNSKKSVGMGWGSFIVVSPNDGENG